MNFSHNKRNHGVVHGINMSDSELEKKEVEIESDVRGLKLEGDGDEPVGLKIESSTSTPHATNSYPSPIKRSQSRTQSGAQSPVKSGSEAATPNGKMESTVGGDITVKLEPGKAPKLSRSSSQKVISRAPPLYNDEPDKYEEATSTFQVIEDCIYAAKWLGTTEQAMDCDCREAYADGVNSACDEDSDCINRLTKIECTGEGSCGRQCQNRRFHDKAYADVSVFKTEKKGYGLRANASLEHGDFIFEYIGEVIDEPRFRRRARQYDDEGVKHFYFMSLNKGEFVDATRKGNLGRFCNHSCNPNCYVDKWVVGDKLCMGIFAGRAIKAGEELVFNYNVDRYGANPQPCYCGEPNCTGFIGGKTQTERATKLSDATIEALGIEDGDSWDTAVAKKPKRPRKTGEDDEEYVNKLQPKTLQEDGVNNIMATLMQCKEKWIAVKLLNRILQADEEKVILRIVRMHGYRTLKIVLNEFTDDANVCLQVLGVLFKFPRLTRNKIENSGIEDTIQKLKQSEDERVVKQAAEILDLWSNLTMEYRIPRMKRDPNVVVETTREERKERRARSRSKSRSKSPLLAPAGPRSNMPSRNANFFGGPRPAFRRPPPPVSQLPPGWFEAKDASGKTYYYSATGATQWVPPVAAAEPPPPPPKQITNEERLQKIINDCLKGNATPDNTASQSPNPTTLETPKKKEEKWRSLPMEKQKKMYENTLFNHVKSTIDKFKKKLPRDEIKKLSKEITKALVEKDYKHKRVNDPTRMDKKYAQGAKKAVADFMNKAVKKHREHEKKKKEREAQKKATAAAETKSRESKHGSTTPPMQAPAMIKVEEDDDEDVQVSDDDMADVDEEQAASKRKRENETPATPLDTEEGVSKKLKTEAPPPPPPPPPPPAEDDDAMDGAATPTDELPRQEPSPADTNSSTSAHKDFGVAMKTNGDHSPVQLATPLTNGAAQTAGGN